MTDSNKKTAAPTMKKLLNRALPDLLNKLLVEVNDVAIGGVGGAGTGDNLSPSSNVSDRANLSPSNSGAVGQNYGFAPSPRRIEMTQALAMKEQQEAQQRLLKNLNEKHKTLKIILQNIGLILTLSPAPTIREKEEITDLLSQAENLIDKKIIADGLKASQEGETEEEPAETAEETKEELPATNPKS